MSGEHEDTRRQRGLLCSALLAPGHVQGQGGADGGRGDSSVCWSLGPL